MGQFASGLRRKDEGLSSVEAVPTRGPVVRTRQSNNIFSGVSVHQLFGPNLRIPESFLVHECASSEFADEDGDIANEFYVEQVKEGTRRLRKSMDKLTPQKTEKYRIPRLHPDLPIVLVQVN